MIQLTRLTTLLALSLAWALPASAQRPDWQSITIQLSMRAFACTEVVTNQALVDVMDSNMAEKEKEAFFADALKAGSCWWFGATGMTVPLLGMHESKVFFRVRDPITMRVGWVILAYVDQKSVRLGGKPLPATAESGK